MTRQLLVTVVNVGTNDEQLVQNATQSRAGLVQLFRLDFCVVYWTMLVTFEVLLQADGTVGAAAFGVDRVDERLKAKVTNEIVVDGALVVVHMSGLLGMMTLAADATRDQNDAFAQRFYELDV